MNILVLCETEEALRVAEHLAKAGGIVKVFYSNTLPIAEGCILIQAWRKELDFPDFVVTDSPVLGVKYLKAAGPNAVPLLEVDSGMERDWLHAIADISPVGEIRHFVGPKPTRRWWQFWRRNG